MTEIFIFGLTAISCWVGFLAFAYNEGLSPNGAFPFFTAFLAVMAVIFTIGFLGEAGILIWQMMLPIEATT